MTIIFLFCQPEPMKTEPEPEPAPEPAPEPSPEPTHEPEPEVESEESDLGEYMYILFKVKVYRSRSFIINR